MKSDQSDSQGLHPSVATLALGGMLFLVGLILYVPTMSFEFVQDDLIHIVDNPLISSWRVAFDSFFEPMYPGNLYRPVLFVSYALNYSFAGFDPIWFHATNAVLHGVICFLVFCLLVRIVSRRASFFVTLIFSTHPVHVEAVANISGRSELLCHFFGLLTICCMQGYSDARRLGKDGVASLAYLLGSYVFFLAALFSKESAFIYLLLIPLVLLWEKQKRTGSYRFSLSGLFMPVAVLCCASMLYLMARHQALGGIVVPLSSSAFVDNPLVELSPGLRVYNSLALLGKYAYVSFVPSVLGLDYSYAHQAPYRTLFEPVVMAYFLILLAFLYFALQGVRRRETQGFFALWFLLSFAVTANFLFPIGTIFGERLAYLPSLGVVGLLYVYLMYVRTKLLRYSLLAGVLLVFISQTLLVSRVWRSNETLYTHQAFASPNSVKAGVNYAVVLRNRGELAMASKKISEALQIFPEYAEAYFVRATIQAAEADREQARESLQQTLRINPQHLPARNMLARMEFNKGDLAAAAFHFDIILKQAPGNISALIGKFAVVLAVGDVQQARNIDTLLAERAPNHQEYKMLSKALQQLEEQVKSSGHQVPGGMTGA